MLLQSVKIETKRLLFDLWEDNTKVAGIILSMAKFCSNTLLPLTKRLIFSVGPIVHFTVVCLIAKRLNRSEAKGDLVMIQTLLLLKCKFFFVITLAKY